MVKVKLKGRLRHGLYLGLTLLICFLACAKGQAARAVEELPNVLKFEMDDVAAKSTSQSWTPFQGKGKYEVQIEMLEVEVDNVASTIFLYTPVLNDNSKQGLSWPGIVFAHGLCSRPNIHNERLLTSLSSWGFVIVATDAMGDCETFPYEYGFGLDTPQYRDELIRNVKYISDREDVNSSQIALVGPSMGGGGVITAAAKLSETDPDLIQAVVAIAPWNGFRPTPSSVVSDIKSPILLFCADKDILIPCSGLVTLEFGFRPNAIKLADVLPSFYGAGSRDWSGGVLSIFNNVSESTPAVLAEVKDANHVSISDTTNDGAKVLLEESSSGMLPFLHSELPETQPGYFIPTAEYTVAFLEWALKGDETSYNLIWGENNCIKNDRRFKSIMRNL